MDAGTLDKRIVLQVATVTADAAGQEVQSWATLATVWANVRYPNGREFLAAGSDQASTEASFRIRVRSDVAAGNRISYAGKLWNIKAVLPGGAQHEFMDLPATALD